MLDQLADEKRLIAEGKPGSGTLMSNLVRASEAHHDVAGGVNDARTKMDGKPQDTKPLTVDEILGNIFVFHFAGHDTTAISLAYLMHWQGVFFQRLVEVKRALQNNTTFIIASALKHHQASIASQYTSQLTRYE